MEVSDLRNRFTYHPPQEGQDEMYKLIRLTALQLAGLINERCPEGREKSLAVTHIEEAVFWANASIARS